MKYTLLFIILWVTTVLGQATMAQEFRLENDQIMIAFDRSGTLTDLKNLTTNSQYIDDQQNEIWKLVIETDSFTYDTLSSVDFMSNIRQREDTIEITYNSVFIDKINKYSVSYTVTLQNDEVIWKSSITNNSTLRVSSFEFPILSCKENFTTEASLNNWLYWPHRPGERIKHPTRMQDTLSIKYPGYATMQWMEYGNEKEGLYFSSYDSTLSATYLTAKAANNILQLSYTKHPFISPYSNWQSDPYVVSPHTGNWHTGAKKYRKWADQWIKVQPQPDWVKNAGGWLLTILKQQNGDVMWKYRELPDILSLAQRQGISLIAPFGWAIGGHDHLYPDYSPDPKMGTLQDLSESMKEVQKNGGQTVLFVNGQLVDTLTQYYDTIGRELVIRDLQGEIRYEKWRKFYDYPGYTHHVMCPSTPEWSNKLLSLTHYIDSLGADGIFYDQIGFGGASTGICLTESHQHENPADAVGMGIYQNIKHIRAKIKKTNPDFAFMSEGLNDAISSFFDFSHGSGDGYEYRETSFPALFRYTFPEIIFTNRFSSPYMSPEQANFSMINGLRFDVESRYVTDVALLQDNIRPTRAYFDNLVWPPNNTEELMNESVEQYGAYLKKLNELRAQYPVLLNGTFVDTEGFTITNNAVQARALVDEQQTAVVVWNTTSITESFEVDVVDKALKQSIFMNKGDTMQNLSANGLAIFLFE